ncbi:hypothetical protein MMC22_007979 [Lobaria immixta]|nr:hypothetical protein [Lobaria immixta]
MFSYIRHKLVCKIKASILKEADNRGGVQIDGQADGAPKVMTTRRPRVAGDVCAIFVHAGAGFHSLANEKIHLQVCEDAARSAMTFLNNGGDAVDAVEIAIRILEDREITNAGFGSNLSIDGLVESDATMVDHYGRSGAVGAVGQIRNPIHVARLVLEHSTKPLTLKRVPPNLLVGPGAIEFAFQHGVPIVPNDNLVSRAAEERWSRWKADLDKVDGGEDPDTVDTKPGRKHKSKQSPNNSQPYSPGTSGKTTADSLSPTKQSAGTGTTSRGSASPPREFTGATEIASPKQVHLESSTKSRGRRLESSVGSDGLGYGTSDDSHGENDDDDSFIDDDPPWVKSKALHPKCSADDLITDTVGAIAIDCLGNIAAGSSSGGIGMKHQGRVGPAALVGVGTTVIPIEPKDPKKTCVATVVSGTGEHMATTAAASMCAQRIYSSTRKTKEGHSEPTDDDRAIKSFVEQDFMGHPSVVHSNSTGAIGILGVKKSVDGVWLYFAHNTDTFAIASMGSDDLKPQSLMSRNKGDNKVITGGRSIKHWPKHGWSRSSTATWLSNPDKALNPGELYADESPPKAKKPMFKHAPHAPHVVDNPQPTARAHVDPYPQREESILDPPLTGSAIIVDHALAKSTKGFGNSRGGSEHGYHSGGSSSNSGMAGVISVGAATASGMASC